MFQCKYTEDVCQEVPSPETRLCAIQDDRPNNYLEALLQGSKNDVALRDRNIKEQLVSSEIECALHCVRLPECSSINIGVHKDSAQALLALLVCQLNNATAETEPENLVGTNGFNYYSVFSRHFEN